MPKQVEAHGDSVSDLVYDLNLVTFKGPNQQLPRESVTLVELTVSCRDLADRDVFSKSDPMCVLFTRRNDEEKWTELDHTETIKDNLNPDFVKKFVVEYYFEEIQKLKFVVVDIDSKSKDLKKHDYLGEAEIMLSEIITSCNPLDKPLVNCMKTKKSRISVSAEELSSCKDKVTLQFSARELDNLDLIGKSDPFLRFSRSNENHAFTLVHQTEVIMNTLSPTWKPFTIPVRALCNGDYLRSLKVECYDWDSDGSHELIGEFSTTLRKLCEGASPANVYQCINEKKKKKKSYKNSGTILLDDIKVETFPSFMDYIKGGTQINFTIAVDFTKSNGDIKLPSSLHYRRDSPDSTSQYEQAIKVIGEIIQEYDSDRQFPALGFGAKLPPDGKLSHMFFMNGHPMNPFCEGIDGVIRAYHRTLDTVQLDGPTNFAPIINHVAGTTKQTNGNYYSILLILTDDNICDMPQTKEAIINASELPLSIIIVGIGKADFTSLKELDRDEKMKAERDIVHFVQFRDFIKDGELCQMQMTLAKDVLAEVPDQFLSYMNANNIKPKPVQATRPLPSRPTSKGYCSIKPT